MTKTNYKAKLLRKEGKQFIQVGQVKFKPNMTQLKINDSKTMDISLDIAYRDGNTVYIFIDLDNDKQISFTEFSSGIDAEDVDTIVTKKLLTSLLMRIHQGTQPLNRSSWFMYVIILLCGVGVGTMIGVIAYPYLIHTATSAPVITPSNIPRI